MILWRHNYSWGNLAEDNKDNNIDKKKLRGFLRKSDYYSGRIVSPTESSYLNLESPYQKNPDPFVDKSKFQITTRNQPGYKNPLDVHDIIDEEKRELFAMKKPFTSIKLRDVQMVESKHKGHFDHILN